MGGRQGRRQAERRAEPGDLLKLRQSGLVPGATGEEHGTPEETWLIQAWLTTSVTWLWARPGLSGPKAPLPLGQWGGLHTSLLLRG